MKTNPSTGSGVNKFFSVILLLLGMVFLGTNCTKETSDQTEETKRQPVVSELEQLINTDTAFQDSLNKALVERPKNNFWHNKDTDDLLEFFDEWLTKLPSPDPQEARYYDDTFGDFYVQDRASIEPAKTLTREEPFLGWLEKFVEARGEYMDSEESAAGIEAWTESENINMDDYDVPRGGFKSFNEFFTRELEPNKRPISDPDNDLILISPADCEISASTIPLTDGAVIEAKGMNLRVDDLLGGDPAAEDFYGGTAASFGLGVTDYHRFHSPVRGNIMRVAMLGGRYFGISTFDEFFTENHRGYMIINTPDHGKVALVAIGITTISSVNFSKTAGEDVAKGEELGNFAYGGSEVLLLFEPDRFEFGKFAEDEHVLMGQKIGIYK